MNWLRRLFRGEQVFGGLARSPQWETLSRTYRPELELVKSNWMNVCRFHHLWHCHLGSWKSINPNAQKDVETFTLQVRNRRK